LSQRSKQEESMEEQKSKLAQEPPLILLVGIVESVSSYI